MLFQTIKNTSAFIGNGMGFVAKQYFCFYALDGVRENLDKIISDVAQECFGSFIGGFVGSQIAFATAVPYTVFLGDLLWTTVSELTQTIAILSAKSFGIVEQVIQEIPIWIDIAIRVAATSIGYFGKQMFIYTAMPTVKIAIEKLLLYAAEYGTTNTFLQNIVYTLSPFGAVTLAPITTFFLADLIGYFLQTSFYVGSKSIATFAYNHFAPPEAKKIR